MLQLLLVDTAVDMLDLRLAGASSIASVPKMSGRPFVVNLSGLVHAPPDSFMLFVMHLLKWDGNPIC